MAADRVFKGATRPALLFGVPVVSLVLVEGCLFLIALWLYLLASGTAAAVVGVLVTVAWVAMRIETRKDDQRLHQLGLKVRLRLRGFLSGSWSYWNSATSSPLPRQGSRR
jgi:type IV secretion system protein VirB3